MRCALFAANLAARTVDLHSEPVSTRNLTSVLIECDAHPLFLAPNDVTELSDAIGFDDHDKGSRDSDGACDL